MGQQGITTHHTPPNNRGIPHLTASQLIASETGPDKGNVPPEGSPPTCPLTFLEGPRPHQTLRNTIAHVHRGTHPIHKTKDSPTKCTILQDTRDLAKQRASSPMGAEIKPGTQTEANQSAATKRAESASAPAEHADKNRFQPAISARSKNKRSQSGYRIEPQKTTQSTAHFRPPCKPMTCDRPS